jgi:hypothetical protein
MDLVGVLEGLDENEDMATFVQVFGLRRSIGYSAESESESESESENDECRWIRLY